MKRTKGGALNKSIWIPALLLAIMLLSACGQSPLEPAETFPEPSPEQIPLSEPVDWFPVELSEVMASNKATLPDETGSFPDWVELYNSSGEDLELDQFSLMCSEKRQGLDGSIGPGEYRVAFCPDLGISARGGEELKLLAPGGTILDRMVIPATEEDTSWTHEGLCLWPSPGYENGPLGYETFQSGHTAGELCLWAAAAWDPEGDWVELKNESDREIDLTGYALSDKRSQPLRAPLTGTIAPGGILRLKGEDLGLRLDAEGDQLFLCRDDGSLCDWMCLRRIPCGGHLGRTEGEEGFFYFDAGGAFARRVSSMPELTEGSDGVFEGVESVSPHLEAAGEIRYTTDGSLPTAESPLWQGDLELRETCVLRAVSVEEGALCSPALSLSYILNEGHSLPVVSLACDPDAMFKENTGIYANPTLDQEIPAAVMFYEQGGSFSRDCGLELHGATSRLAQPKKSMKLSFRSRFGGDLEYDLFSNGVTSFHSLLLRADQESSRSTYMRDVLMHTLAEEAFPELCVQDHKYAVLYINGAYWGIYSLREAHSPEHFSRHFGYDAEQVIQWKRLWDKSCPFRDDYQFMMTNSPSKEENYRQATAHLDTDSVIAWCILQAYSGNFDFAPPNMRFYWTQEDEKLHYALVDLDLGMFDYYAFTNPLGGEYDYCNVITWLLGNRDFRMEFLRRTKEALEGPLEDGHVQALVRQLASELRPEIQRDARRWDESAEDWEKMVVSLENYFGLFEGRDSLVLASLKGYIENSADWHEVFGPEG